LNTHQGFKALGDEERRKWQNPEAILADIGLQPGLTFMDIGCGEGFFALPAARLVGERGRAYGLDMDGESIGRLSEKAATEGLRNLILKVGKAEEAVLCQACADVVFLGIVLHDFEEPVTVLKNAGKMLKPAGHLVNLDWKKEAMDFGAPLYKRFSEEEAVRLIEAAGFRMETVAEAGPYHYLMVAKRQSS